MSETYKLIEKNGKQVLKRFNDKTKMWVTLTFKDDENMGIEDLFKNIIKTEYINSIIY